MEAENGEISSDNESGDGVGLFPYVMCYCENCNTPLHEVFSQQVFLVLTAVAYIVKRNKDNEQKIKQMNKRHGG